jgi:hypothetical protein
MHPRPDSTITPGDSVLCPGDAVRLTAAQARSWRWSTGARSRSINAADPGRYRVRLTSAEGCSAEGAVRLRPGALPDTPRLVFERGRLAARPAPAASSTLVWTRNGQPLPASDAAVEAGRAGTYRLRVTSPDGCSTTAAFALERPVEGTAVRVRPNPFGEALTVELDLAVGGEVALRLVTAGGAEVYTASETLGGGAHTRRLRTAGWAAGVYLLEVRLPDGGQRRFRLLRN